MHVGNSLNSFGLLILSLQQLLDKFDVPMGPDDMAAGKRISFLWSEKEMADYSNLLDRQVKALNLLLQAIHFETWAQQETFISREENQHCHDNMGIKEIFC
ncbi:hypothetical protein F5B20DRAFT_565194, partial [Whalleya microplaca]